MSFQDVRRRQHPIFDNHRRSGHSINAPTLQTMERTDYKPSRRQSPITQQSPREFQHKLQQRGVRPRLSTICPVTAKILMDDQASLGTQETAPSVDTLSSQDESDIPTILPLRHDMTSSRSLSIFAHLTTSIVNFQKMIAELESLVDDAGVSPEVQWRTRILIHSAQDADRDLQARLYQLDESSHSSSRAQVALRKLHRDFGRVHKDLRKVLTLYERKQQVEVSFLNKNESKEEFFDRAMREREQEVTKIHQSMHQVNAIYKDLAGLVEAQQDQIGRIGEATEESKANTRQGLREVQNGFMGLCGPVGGHVVEKKPKEDGFRVNEEFKWSMPFETIGDDILAVQSDVLQFGRDLIEDLQDTMVQGRLSGCSQNFECHDQVEQVRFESSCMSTNSSIRSDERH